MVLVDHKDKKTELELEDDSVIITDKMARMMEVEAGDTITIEVDETTKKEVKVQAVAENYIYHYVYMNEATYASIFEKDATYNKVLFSVKDGVDSDALTEEMLDLTAVNNVTFNTTIQDKFGDVLQSIDIIVLVLLVSAGGLAFVVLYNLNNINLAERRRELATLKVLGFYDSEVTGYVYRENVLITILGIVVGCLLGVVLHRFVIVTAEIDAITFYRQIQVRSFVYSGILTAVFSIVINLAMYFKLKKIDLAASMKSVE
jgi:putative ABC transport system permease protein